VSQFNFTKKLKLFITLHTKKSLHKKETARIYGVDERTIERYIKEFKSYGMIITNRNGFYIVEDEGKIKNLPLFTISEDEAEQLWYYIQSADVGSPIHNLFYHRLQVFFEENLGTKFIFNFKKSENIKQLQVAIKNKKQVLLKDYASAYSNKISDRIVEPIHFTTNYKMAVCYDVDKKDIKHFSTSRITEVEILGLVQYQSQHHKLLQDVFGISSKQSYPIKLKLSTRAKQLLIEEYPQSEPYITDAIFKTEVMSFEGVGRFVLGLFDEVEVIESEAFKEFLRKKLKKMHSKY